MPEETTLKVMGTEHEQTERIEALRGLTERLSAPDLILTEVKVVRGHLSDLLEHDSRRAEGDRMAFSPVLVAPPGRGDRARHDVWSSKTSMRAAG